MMNQFLCYCKYLSSIFIPALLIVFFAQSCKKEATLSSSGLDKNIFTNRDNPNDPIDHEIFNFYKATGVASFYNDTAFVQKISNEGERPEKYRHIKLSLDYYPTGIGNHYSYIKLTSKQKITNILPILQFEVFPKLPTVQDIPSILYIDSLLYSYAYLRTELSHGLTAAFGFNTVGIVVKDVKLMSDADKKMYVASLLAGFAVKTLRRRDEVYLQQNFFSVSRALAKNVVFTDVYIGVSAFSGVIPSPNSIAFLYLPISANFFLIEGPALPTEDSDLRSFLTMLFRYNEADLTIIYESYPPILQKFTLIRQLLLKHGYKLPE